MKKASVYTRTGDKGLTGLVGGTRIKKSDARIHLYGEVDELNSHLGVALAFLDSDKHKGFLHEVQSRLFDIGSNLACEAENIEKYQIPQINAEHIKEMEKEIDELDNGLERMTHFILPGGTKAASLFHVCRTVARRIERQMIGSELTIDQNILIYVNRLSDYFFVLSRAINSEAGESEIKWIPQKK